VTGSGTERGDELRPGGALTGERGAGSVLVLAVVAATVLVTGMLAPVAGISVVRHRATTAADAAALAAADSLVGVTTGDPCERAGEVAAAAGASVLRCVPDGLVVTVRVRVVGTFIPVEADATAGPAG